MDVRLNFGWFGRSWLLIALLFFDDLFGDIDNLVLAKKLIVIFRSLLVIFHIISRTGLFTISLSCNFLKAILQIATAIHLVVSSQFGEQVHNAIVLFGVD